MDGFVEIFKLRMALIIKNMDHGTQLSGFGFCFYH